MSGKTKRKYISELVRFNKSLKRPLCLIQEVLPYDYNKFTILNLFKELYPFEWDTIVQRYKHYKEKDNFLKSKNKQKRYYPQNPEEYFFNLQKVKHLTSHGQKLQHKKNYDAKKQAKQFYTLRKKRKGSIEKKQKRIAKVKEIIQFVEPLYIDIFINEYHRKGITVEEKIEILKELQKYESEKTIEFFYKINDSEKNNQVRRIAFNHLQNIGRYVKLRKNFKGKQKTYMIEKSNFFMKPDDLYKRIKNDSIQNKKVYDYFISHSLVDNEIVLKILRCLNSLDYSVYCDWLSDNDFLKREYISEYTILILKKRIEQSRNILFIQTSNTTDENNNLRSPWIQMELDYAKELRKNIVCIDLLQKDKCEFDVLKYDNENNILVI